MDWVELQTVDEVLAKLGGPTMAAALVNKTAQNANSWKIAKKFPAKTYVAFSRELRARGCTAPLRLWGMLEPTEVSA